MVKAITPQEVLASPEKAIPYFVIEAINNLIQASFRNGSATIMQDDAVQAILENVPGFMGMTRQEIFEAGYLDFEEVYRKQGWIVIHDRPGFNESYKPYYRFTVNSR